MARPPKPRIVDYKRHLLVCTGRCCVADGMDTAALKDLGDKLIAAGVLQSPAQRVKPSRVDCLGACRSGPVMCVQPDGIWYYGVTPIDMDRIIEQHLIGGQVVEELVFHRGPEACHE
ncbi:MAG: hypothetical protein NVSMB34_04790 [Variovorax sp.]